MKKVLQEEENKIDWRAKGYPKYRGTVQVDRFSRDVQEGLKIFAHSLPPKLCRPTYVCHHSVT